MAKYENLPFDRGTTWNGGATPDANNLGGSNLEGRIFEIEDIDWSQAGGAKPVRSNRPVKLMCVRNVSGITLLPKRLVTLAVTKDGLMGQVDGYATETSVEAYPIDEFLPATGVVDDDLFYIVIEGPATVLTDLAAAATCVISVGDWLVSLTAATSQATTAGRVAPQDLTGATTPLAKQVMNRIGRALSAKTTNNTNASLLIDMRRW